MKKDNFEPKGHKRRTVASKAVVLALALVLLAGGVVGGTVAWLTAQSDAVTNTFTESDIGITLSETKPENKTAPMVPGWTIEKNPKVTVDSTSEDCWLFVRITESAAPDLDTYISYTIAGGWTTVDDKDNNDDTIVIGRKVYKDDTAKEFGIIGYTDTNGTEAATDDVFVADKVLVNDTVTKALMDAIDGEAAKPTLSFQAYAVQLFKTNNDGSRETTADEFDINEAWAKASGMNSGN